MGEWVLVLIALAFPLAVIYLLVAVWRLKARLARLEGIVQRQVAARQVVTAPDLPPALMPASPASMPLDSMSPVAAPLPAAPAPGAATEATPNPWALPVAGGRGGAAVPAEPPRPMAKRDDQDRPLVFNADRMAQLSRWVVANWVYVVSAVSLALAGVFLLQYGVENGLLPPPLRVLAALALGAGLVAAGEWLRRRHGDEAGATAYLPSTFSAAGIIAMFAAILAARQMYGLIGPLPTFAGLVLVAAGALVLGWRNGPLLAAIGLIGATAAPFLTGGEAQAIGWLYPYVGLIAAVGLGIDAWRRWAWVSVLALGLGYGGGMLIHLGGGEAAGLALLAVALAGLALAVPTRSLVPALTGITVLGALWHRARKTAGATAWPGFPTRLAAGAMVASVAVLALLPVRDAGSSVLILFGLAALAGAVSIWAARSPALSDLAVLPLAGFVFRLLRDPAEFEPLFTQFRDAALALRAPGVAAPATMTLIVAIAVAMTLAFAARTTWAPGDRPRWWAALAAATLPATGFALEVQWAPREVIGPYPWALHAMAAAALMTGLALWFARAGRGGPAAVAYAALSALTLITFAMFAVLTKGALTLALAALIVAAAGLDRRFRLPELGWFVQLATAVLGWRLVVDPGVLWAVEQAPLWQALAAHGGAVAAMAMGLRLLSGLDRRGARVVLESGLFAFAALLANVVLMRLLQERLWANEGFHWIAALMALPWLLVALAQLYRMQLGGGMAVVRAVLAGMAALIWGSGMLTVVTLLNPVLTAERVAGPPALNSLVPAYLVPGVVLLVSLRWLGHLPRLLKRGILGLGVAFVTLYAGLAIRHWFQGPYLNAPGTTQGELYTYTIALMATGAALLYQAIARRSAPLRRVAMTVIALTVAKVFLIDISGLSGLTRVFSFLALGLSLAGLAWLNRWAAGRQEGRS